MLSLVGFTHILIVWTRRRIDTLHTHTKKTLRHLLWGVMWSIMLCKQNESPDAVFIYIVEGEWVSMWYDWNWKTGMTNYSVKSDTFTLSICLLAGMSRRWFPVTRTTLTCWPTTLVIVWRCWLGWMMTGCSVLMVDWRAWCGCPPWSLCTPDLVSTADCLLLFRANCTVTFFTLHVCVFSLIVKHCHSTGH